MSRIVIAKHVLDMTTMKQRYTGAFQLLEDVDKETGN
jgi:hypothetical protein